MDAPITLNLGLVNAFLLVSERCVLIDTGYPGSGDMVEALVRRADVDPSRISLILISHAHLDHCGSAAALRGRWKVPVACAREDAGDMASGVNRHLKPLGAVGLLAAPFARSAAALSGKSGGLSPDILFSGPESLASWGVDAWVVPSPGHTPGSISVVPGGAEGPVRNPAWAVAGDLAFGRLTAPRRARLPIFAGDRAALSASLRRFSSVGRAYLGHGGPVPGADFAALADRLDR